jgi:hypothetical protein
VGFGKSRRYGPTSLQVSPRLYTSKTLCRPTIDRITLLSEELRARSAAQGPGAQRDSCTLMHHPVRLERSHQSFSARSPREASDSQPKEIVPILPTLNPC